MSTGDREVDDFIGSHSDAELLPTGKVRCTLTSHEMPAKVNLLREHWSSKKYKNCKERATYDFKQHEPWIVQHLKNPHLLYCTLTKQAISKQPHAVDGHVKAKRYLRLLKAQKEGKPFELRTFAGTVPEKRGDAKATAADGDDGVDAFPCSAEDVDELLEDEEDGDEDEDEDADDDAAEFLREGAFWEDDEGDEETAADKAKTVVGKQKRKSPEIYRAKKQVKLPRASSSVSKEGAAHEDLDCAEDDEEIFWTRPKIVTQGQRSKPQARK